MFTNENSYDHEFGSVIAAFREWINTPEGRRFEQEHAHDGVSIDYLWRRDIFPAIKARTLREREEKRRREQTPEYKAKIEAERLEQENSDLREKLKRYQQQEKNRQNLQALRNENARLKAKLSRFTK